MAKQNGSGNVVSEQPAFVVPPWQPEYEHGANSAAAKSKAELLAAKPQAFPTVDPGRGPFKTKQDKVIGRVRTLAEIAAEEAAEAQKGEQS